MKHLVEYRVKQIEEKNLDAAALLRSYETMQTGESSPTMQAGSASAMHDASALSVLSPRTARKTAIRKERDMYSSQQMDLSGSSVSAPGAPLKRRLGFRAIAQAVSREHGTSVSHSAIVRASKKPPDMREPTETGPAPSS